MRIPQNTLHSIEAGLMNSFAAICERSSWTQCRYLGARLGLLFHGLLPSRRRVSIRNLQLAFPNLSDRQANRLARRASQNASMTFCEFMHMGVASDDEIRDYVMLDGMDHYHKAHARGKGVIILTGHLGNWELLGARATLDVPVTVIARPRSNRAVHEKIESVRAKRHMRVISRFDTGRAPMRTLRRGETIGILPDQYEKNGPVVPFFGQPTRVVDAVARLAYITGASVLPAFGVRREPWLQDGKITMRASPAFTMEQSDDRDTAVLEGTQRGIAELEKAITAFPDQWLWMHHRWRAEDGVEFKS